MGKEHDRPVNRLLKNSLFLVAARMIDFGSVIVTTPVIARYLGLKEFGNYAFILAITMFIKPLAEFGSEKIICRDIANNKENASVYIVSTSVLRAIICVVIIAVTYMGAHIFLGDKKLAVPLIVATISEIITVFSTVFFAVIRAYERMEYELVCNFVHKIISVIAIIAVVVLDMGFLSLFEARLFSAIVFLILSLYFVFRRLVKFKPILNWSIAGSIFKESMPLLLLTILVTSSSRVDIFVLKYFWDSTEVALFEAPGRIITQLQFIPLAVTLAMFPFLSTIYSDKVRFKLYYEKAIKFFYIFSIFPMMLMFINSESIVKLLFGDNFILSSNSFKVLSLTFMFLTIIPFNNHILIILGQQRYITLSAIICFTSNLLIDLLLIPAYGYIGASIATFTASLIYFACTAVFVSRYLRDTNLHKEIIKPMIGLLISGIVCYSIVSSSIYSLVLTSILGFVIYFGILLLLKTFKPNEFSTIKDMFVKRKKEKIAPV